MNWRKVLSELPIVIFTDKTPDEEVFHEVYNNVQCLFVHEYIPKWEAIYHLIMIGPKEDCLQILIEIESELGESLDGLRIGRPPMCSHHYIWKSPSDDLPESYYHRILSRETINKVYREENLTQREVYFADKSLVEAELCQKDQESYVLIDCSQTDEINELSAEKISRALVKISWLLSLYYYNSNNRTLHQD